jgi:hypothetical protein
VYDCDHKLLDGFTALHARVSHFLCFLFVKYVASESNQFYARQDQAHKQAANAYATHCKFAQTQEVELLKVIPHILCHTLANSWWGVENQWNNPAGGGQPSS